MISLWTKIFTLFCNHRPYKLTRYDRSNKGIPSGLVGSSTVNRVICNTVHMTMPRPDVSWPMEWLGHYYKWVGWSYLPVRGRAGTQTNPGLQEAIPEVFALSHVWGWFSFYQFNFQGPTSGIWLFFFFFFWACLSRDALVQKMHTSLIVQPIS